MILGISGKRGAGKDTLCESLKRMLAAANVDVRRVGLADEIKWMIIHGFDVPIDIAFGDDNAKQLPLPHGPPLFTVRDALKKIGGAYRDIEPAHWLRRCLDNCERICKVRPALCVIPDVRYRNEVAGIQARGGRVIRLTRCPVPDNHPSETELDAYTGFDAVIDNTACNATAQAAQAVGLLRSWGMIHGS